MKKTRIEGVVLDLGGVLIRLDSVPFFEVWGHQRGKTVREFVEAIEAWGMYDRWERGGCTEGEFIEAFKEWIGLPSLDVKEFRKHWNGIFPEAVRGAAGILRKLKKRFRLYALSNTTDTHFKYLLQRYRWLKEFDRIFTSYGLKARKPEPEIFQRMLVELRMEPQTLFYIDDRLENVAVARSLGFRAEHCPGPEKFKSLLEKYGLLG